MKFNYMVTTDMGSGYYIYISLCIVDLFKNFVHLINACNMGSMKLSCNFLCSHKIYFYYT